MSRKLDIDTDMQRWTPAFDAFLRGAPAVCPVCGSASLEPAARSGPDRIGFLFLSCPDCGKTGYLSRVRFPEELEIEPF
ncbi:MAG: hypothetical protein ACI3U8_07400 [Candidatus Onthomonas sp.]